MILICPECGTKNRIPDVSRPGTVYRCGKCKEKLIYTPETGLPRDNKSDIPTADTAERGRDTLKPLRTFLGRLSYLHPLLFAISPVLLLYSLNLADVTPSAVAMPLIAALGLGVLILLLSLLVIALIYKIRRRSDTPAQTGIWDFKKAAITTSIFLILFFNYGHAFAIVGGEWYGLAIVWILLFIIGAILILRTRRNLGNLTGFLAVFGAILVILPAIEIINHEIQFGGRDATSAGIVEINALDVASSETLPDIYYIVPDRYGSVNSLYENFDFDNSEFVDYLTGKGFFVASDSMSNYSRTFASLASSLNMEYINYLTEDFGEDFGHNYPMWELIQDNAVWRFLKSEGYQFINLGDKWDGTRVNYYADVNYNLFTIQEFPWLLFTKTLAYPFCVELFDIVQDPRVTHYENVLYHFEKLAEIPNVDGPTFTFAHMLIPHDPYVFDSNGNYKTPHEEQQKTRIDNFIDNLTFLNSQLKVLIDELLASSDVPPIIILQADEGPFSLIGQWLGEDATEAALRVKMGILNAYYLPEVDNDVLYSAITPVNSFRLVFDLYFGTDLGLRLRPITGGNLI